MSKLKSRLAVLALGATAGLLLLPATGQGAVNFGSRLQNEPTEQTCMAFGTCTIASFIHPIDPEGEPYSGGAPIAGVITKFKVRAYAVEAPGQVTFRVVDVVLPDPNNNDAALGTATGTGPTITIQPDEMAVETPITEVAARVPVGKGQHLAIDTTESIAAVYNPDGSRFSYLFAPPLVDGAAVRGSNEATNELLVAATIEPDADNDGFGDETQDGCPSQASTQGPCDLVKPDVSGLRVAGGRISYRLSESATVSLKLERKTLGRRIGKRCVRQTPKNKKRKRCARFKRIGAVFSGPGRAGANGVALPNGKRLKPGRYRLTLTARDAAGNESKKTTTFVVKKKKKRRKRA